MPSRSHTARTATVVIIAVLLVGLGRCVPVYAQTTPTAGAAPVAKGQEPAVLKIIMDAGWKLNAAQAQPPVQVVHEEKLETQNWVQLSRCDDPPEE